MINIDLSSGLTHTFKATLTEKMTQGYTIFLDLFNFYTNKLYTYQTLTIDFGSRFDTITVSLDNEYDSQIAEAGNYEYIFYQVIGGEKVACERGLCRIVGTTETYYELEPDETDDDYITYNP